MTLRREGTRSSREPNKRRTERNLEKTEDEEKRELEACGRDGGNGVVEIREGKNGKEDKETAERKSMDRFQSDGSGQLVYQGYAILRKHAAKHVFVSLRRLVRRRSLRPAFRRLFDLLGYSGRRRQVAEEKGSEEESWRQRKALNALFHESKERKGKLKKKGRQQQEEAEERQKIVDSRSKKPRDRSRSVSRRHDCHARAISQTPGPVWGDGRLLSKTLPTVFMCLVLKPLVLRRLQQTLEVWRMKTRYFPSSVSLSNRLTARLHSASTAETYHAFPFQTDAHEHRDTTLQRGIEEPA